MSWHAFLWIYPVCGSFSFSSYVSCQIRGVFSQYFREYFSSPAFSLPQRLLGYKCEVLCHSPIGWSTLNGSSFSSHSLSLFICGHFYCSVFKFIHFSSSPPISYWACPLRFLFQLSYFLVINFPFGFPFYHLLLCWDCLLLCWDSPPTPFVFNMFPIVCCSIFLKSALKSFSN